MIVNNVELEAVGTAPEHYPEASVPEFAFIGRSNVGKSSLINTMMNRKALARTSGTPGKTRTINFYNVEKKLYFVDLPGYGYARASKSESEKWGKMIETYLKTRETLCRILLLIDIRHEPSANDKLMFDWLRYYDKPFIIIATKADKLKRSQVQKHVAMLRRTLELDKETAIIPFSSETKSGRDELWAQIDACCQEIPPETADK